MSLLRGELVPLRDRELRLRSRIDQLLDERDRLRWEYGRQIAELEEAMYDVERLLRLKKSATLTKLQAAIASRERWRERALAAEWRVRVLEGRTSRRDA